LATGVEHPEISRPIDAASAATTQVAARSGWSQVVCPAWRVSGMKVESRGIGWIWRDFEMA
jgi:hypothetical protein